jgi:hypothetical protein
MSNNRLKAMKPSTWVFRSESNSLMPWRVQASVRIPMHMSDICGWRWEACGECKGYIDQGRKEGIEMKNENCNPKLWDRILSELTPISFCPSTTMFSMFSLGGEGQILLDVSATGCVVYDCLLFWFWWEVGGGRRPPTGLSLINRRYNTWASYLGLL